MSSLLPLLPLLRRRHDSRPRGYTGSSHRDAPQSIASADVKRRVSLRL